MSQTLRRFQRHQERREDIEKIAALIDEGELLPEEVSRKPLRASADGHRSDRMRGFPIVARGVSGTMPGTVPLAAAIRAESRRHR